jgi:peptidylglycine monooxygenase
MGGVTNPTMTSTTTTLFLGLPLFLLLLSSQQLLVSAGWFSSDSSKAAGTRESTLQMPGVVPQQNESYLCTAFPLNDDTTHYVVGFEPKADMREVHHMLVFGCEMPGSEEEVWDCGEMSSEKGRYARSPSCVGQPDIIYAWARNAPKLELPKGVGFRVGGPTRNRYLVLQVHYMHAMQREDHSGVVVSSTTEEQPRTAATLLLATGGSIPAKSTELLEAACVVDEEVEMHPFAYRVHTHRHGVKVGGWAVSAGADGNEQWALVGERDPQLPQMFEPVANKSLTVRAGDIVAARCEIKNDETHAVEVGATGEDEMCNFYMMYWVEGDRVLQDNTCFSPGPPEYYWSREGAAMAAAAAAHHH